MYIYTLIISIYSLLTARYEIIIGRLKTWTSLSNMPKYKTGLLIPAHPGYEWDFYEKSPPMSTYTVAMVVLDNSLYNFTETNARDIQIRAWHPLKWHADVLQPYHRMELNANYTVKFLIFFEDYFNIDYKLPKLDSIMYTTNFQTATENWGLISYREDKFVYPPTVAHELSHNWFGNLITCKSFNE